MNQNVNKEKVKKIFKMKCKFIHIVSKMKNSKYKDKI